MRTITRTFTVMWIVVVLLSASINAWATSHRYDTGTIASISDKEILMAGKVYKVTKGIKVIFKTKDSKGAVYERKGSLSGLRVGEQAFLKVTGYDILEIEVLR